MSAHINSRALISLSLFLALTVMLVTSIVMFVKPHQDWLALIHTIFGFWILLLLGWHIKSNFKPLKYYLAGPKGQRGYWLPWGCAGLFSALLISAYLQLPPFKQFYIWGQKTRSATIAVQSEESHFKLHTIKPAQALGAEFIIEFRKGPYFMWPQYAIWLETLDGKFIQPLYVTSKLGSNSFSNKVTKKNPQRVFTNNPLSSGENEDDIFDFSWEPASKDDRARPESLPVFLHALGLQSSSGAYVPEKGTPVLDAYSGATLLENFVLNTQALAALPNQFKIRFEINQSFDFNAFYSSDRFPDDPIYSGNGYSAQPSVIYETIVDLRNEQQIYLMKLIGHGHHSGGDGNVNPDISHLTTAKHLVEKILIEMKNSDSGKNNNEGEK